MADALVARFRRLFPGTPAIIAEIEAEIAAPSVTVLFGPSGVGKSTVLRCIAGLERPDAGFIRYGAEVWAEGNTWKTPQQRKVGFLFQDSALFPHLSVCSNAAFGLVGFSRAARRTRALAVLERLGVRDLADRWPSTLSGGQRRRVALARALAPSPRVLLLDEPLTGLDLPSRASLAAELRRLLLDLPIPSFVVTHDRREAALLGDQLVVMDGGRTAQSGPLSDVLTRPISEGVARVLGYENVLPVHVEHQEPGGLATVRLGHAALRAPGGVCHGEAALCVHAEDVELAAEGQGLPARVVSLEPEGATTRVAVDLGARLVARLSAAAARERGLRPGVVVGVRIAASAAWVIPRDPLQ